MIHAGVFDGVNAFFLKSHLRIWYKKKCVERAVTTKLRSQSLIEILERTK